MYITLIISVKASDLYRAGDLLYLWAITLAGVTDLQSKTTGYLNDNVEKGRNRKF